MLWLIRDGNKKVPVFTGTFSALGSTNGYICQFSLQQQEAEPEPGSRAEAHSLNSASFETKKIQHFSLGQQQNVWGRHDDVRLIQGIPLSSPSSTSAAPMISLLTTLEIFGQPSHQLVLANLLNLSFSSSDTQKQGQLQNGQSLAQMWNSHPNVQEKLYFLISLILHNQLSVFFVFTAHKKKGSWSFQHRCCSDRWFYSLIFGQHRLWSPAEELFKGLFSTQEQPLPAEETSCLFVFKSNSVDTLLTNRNNSLLFLKCSFLALLSRSFY